MGVGGTTAKVSEAAETVDVAMKEGKEDDKDFFGGQGNLGTARGEVSRRYRNTSNYNERADRKFVEKFGRIFPEVKCPWHSARALSAS